MRRVGHGKAHVQQVCQLPDCFRDCDEVSCLLWKQTGAELLWFPKSRKFPTGMEICGVRFPDRREWPMSRLP